MLFTYEFVQLVRVKDGDTLNVIIDHGCSIFSKQTVRLGLIQAAELDSRDPLVRAEAERAKAELVRLVPVAESFSMTTTKEREREGFGRLLARIVLRSGLDVGATMLATGFAPRYKR